MCEPFVTRQISIRQSNSVQTDLSISSSTLATAVVLRCFSSFKLTGSGGTKTLSSTLLRKLQMVLILHNVESVYFFYSNPVYPRIPWDSRCAFWEPLYCSIQSSETCVCACVRKRGGSNPYSCAYFYFAYHMCSKVITLKYLQKTFVNFLNCV